MNKFYISILSFIVIGLIACGREKESANKSTVAKLLENNNKNKFEDFFTTVDTLHLEFTDKSILGAVSQVCSHPLGYLVLDSYYSKDVFLFDHSGCFLRKLGSKGLGPGEYSRPTCIDVDHIGNSFILDRAKNIILLFDVNGNHIQDYNLTLQAVHPTFFSIINNSNRFYLFCPESTNEKIIIVEWSEAELVPVVSFGRSEGLKEHFASPPVGGPVISMDGKIWVGKPFELAIEVYDLTGDYVNTIESHIKILPKPHVRLEYFRSLNRLSEALDLYYKYTRFNKFWLLGDFILAQYFGPETKKINNYFVFFTSDGSPLDILIYEEGLNSIVGSCDNTLYGVINSNDSVNENLNPLIVMLKLNNSH